MGTFWSAQIVGGDSGCRPAIEAVLARIIAAMSHWEPASDLSRFNAAPLGAWVSLPEELLFVLRAGLDVARALYERFGFRLESENDADQWAGGVREQVFERPAPSLLGGDI